MTTTRSMTPTRFVLALVAAGLLGGAGASFVGGTRAHAAAPAALTAPLSGSLAAAPDFKFPDYTAIADASSASVAVDTSSSATQPGDTDVSKLKPLDPAIGRARV